MALKTLCGRLQHERGLQGAYTKGTVLLEMPWWVLLALHTKKDVDCIGLSGSRATGHGSSK